MAKVTNNSNQPVSVQVKGGKDSDAPKFEDLRAGETRGGITLADTPANRGLIVAGVITEDQGGGPGKVTTAVQADAPKS